MRLIDDDREGSPAMAIPDFVQDERELLHCRDDDLLSLLQERPQLLRAYDAMKAIWSALPSAIGDFAF